MLFLSLLQLAIIPFFNGQAILECDCSLILIILLHSALVFCEILLGLSSGSKFGVIGGVRAYLQYVGSHIPFVLAIVCVMLNSRTLSLSAVTMSPDPLFFAVFFITSLIMANKVPFDFPEAESEIVGGAYVEYGGILFGMIYLSDYLNLIFASSLITAIFLGGSFVMFLIKTVFIIGFIITIRATLPRYRQDQMLRLSWLIITPILVGYMIIMI
jgi:NADH-quinone oxidoreductase subunit H